MSLLIILWPAVSIWVVFKGTKNEKTVVVAAWLLDLAYPLLISLIHAVGGVSPALIRSMPYFTLVTQILALSYVTYSFNKRKESIYWQFISAATTVLHTVTLVNLIVAALR